MLESLDDVDLLLLQAVSEIIIGTRTPPLSAGIHSTLESIMMLVVKEAKVSTDQA